MHINSLRNIPSVGKSSNASKLNIVLNLSILVSFFIMSVLISRWLDERLQERSLTELTRVSKQARDMIDVYAILLEQSTQTLGQTFASTLPEEISIAEAAAQKGATLSVPILRGNGVVLNGNNAVVDHFAKATGATASVFVRFGSDFMRVATSVRTEEGARATGTLLGRGHPAYAALSAGKPFTGMVTLFGKDYMADYRPLHSSNGELIGATYIGTEFSESLSALKQKLLSIRIGTAGYLYVMDVKRNPGQVLIHPLLSGINVLASPDADTRVYAQRLLAQQSGIVQYNWAASKSKTGPFRKVAAIERFEKWGWVVAASIYEDDIYREGRDLRGQLVLFGMLITAVLLLVVFFTVRRFRAGEVELRASEERLKSLFQFSPVGIVLADMHGNFIDFNRAYQTITGYDARELKALGFKKITVKGYEEDEKHRFDSLLKHGCYGPYEKEYITKSGGLVQIQSSGALVKGQDGQDYVWSIVEDISARHRAEMDLKLAASVFLHLQEGIAIVDSEGNFLDANEAFSAITGYAKQEIIGKNPRLLKSGRHDLVFYHSMWESLSRNGYWRGELWNRRKNGEVFPCQLTISAVRDNQAKVSHYVSIFSDVTVLKEHEVKLERMANYDSLTGLPNRSLLSDRMRQAISRANRKDGLLAICYLDLDNFKPINDAYGHQVGDRVLTEIANRLRAQLRGGDTIARLGGDEFVLLLCGLETTEQSHLAVSRILSSVTSPIKLEAQLINVTASIGVTIYPNDDDAPDILLRHADQAMYIAKESGKNTFHLFDPTLDKKAQLQRQSTRRLEEALSQGEFVLFYQPKVNMRQGQVVGAEALIRWQHPEKGLVPPMEFLPLIEDSDLIVSVGDWVIEEALRQMARWQADGLSLAVSVNIAARQLQKPDFVQKLRDLLAAYPSIPPQWLELEVLETAALEDMIHISRIMMECQSMGVRFALDDFGTGYSSLTYFKRLPADTLKIDQSFVRDMINDSEDLAIVEAVIGLTEVFRRQAVAEGVETIEHGIMLLSMGCDFAQGYSIARPMPAEQVSSWVKKWKPDPAWIAASEARWCREDFPLVLAEIDHRRWVDRVIAVAHGGAIENAPELSALHCNFWRWYQNDGLARFAGNPSFEVLRTLHGELHSLGELIVQVRRQGRTEGLEHMVEKLLRQREQLVGLLHQLLATHANVPKEPLVIIH